jgi:hypothetical protein
MMITSTSGTVSVVNLVELYTPKRSVQNGLRSSTMILSESHTAPKKAFSSYGLHKHDVIPEKIEQKTSSTAKGLEKRNVSEPTVKSQLNASRDSKSCEQVGLVTHDLKHATTFNTKDESNMILHSELLYSHGPEQAYQLRHANVEKVIATDDTQSTIISSSNAENNSAVLTSTSLTDHMDGDMIDKIDVD